MRRPVADCVADSHLQIEQILEMVQSDQECVSDRGLWRVSHMYHARYDKTPILQSMFTEIVKWPITPPTLSLRNRESRFFLSPASPGDILLLPRPWATQRHIHLSYR
jgi:hypothetical protein